MACDYELICKLLKISLLQRYLTTIRTFADRDAGVYRRNVYSSSRCCCYTSRAIFENQNVSISL